MADAPMSFPVALSERERFVLTLFFSATYKPKNKAERKAMRLAFQRLKLDEILARIRKPGGVKQELLSDTPRVEHLNEETVSWVKTNMNNTASETGDSIILSELEDRFDDIAAGKYELPSELQSEASPSVS